MKETHTHTKSNTKSEKRRELWRAYNKFHFNGSGGLNVMNVEQ